MNDNALDNNLGYIGYQEMITDITSSLEDISDIMKSLELVEQADRAKETAKRIKSHVFSVGIMGEFRRGKSTVINALLGESIAPSDIVPTSATLNRITYGPVPKATIMFKDGHQESVPVDRIEDYVTKITESAALTAESVEQAVVEYPCQFCQNNVEIIDTPGLNDDDRMDAISEAVVPKLDAVVLVIGVQEPFSRSEAEFVRNKLMTSDVTRLLVLVNKIDMIYGETDRIRVLNHIKTKITKEILERSAAIHGEDSQLYQETKKKLADITLYPLSAIKALQGKIDGNQALVQESGILVFEDRLRKLLTQERGALEISRAAGIITSLVMDGKSAIELRISSLEMSAKEFAEKQEKADKEIRQLRDKKMEELKRIRNAGRNIKQKMTVIVNEKYEALEQRTMRFLNSYPINPADLNDDGHKTEFQRKFRADLESEISAALSDYAEQINVFLQEQMGDEQLKVCSYMGDLAEHLNGINSTLIKNSSIGTASVVGIDALSNLVAATCTSILSVGGFGLMGLGGLIEGYRAAGVKGAATGVVGGFISSTLTAMGLMAAMGTVPFIPFALLTGLAGTMGGKLLSTAIWNKNIKQKQADQARESLKNLAIQAIDELRGNKLLEEWAQKQVQEQLEALMAQVEENAESMLSSTETTLKSIAADMTEATLSKKQRLEEYQKLANKLQEVNDRIIPIMRRVSSPSVEA